MSAQVVRFLDLFTELEQEVAVIAGRRVRDLSFADKLREAAAKDRRVRENMLFFEACRKLRNVLVHQRFNGRFVADPSPALVEELARTLRLLRDPPRVIQHFRREPREFSPDDPITEVLTYTSVNDFSQVVVRAEGRLDLLSSNTIHRWLADQASVGLVDLGVQVRKVLSHRETDCDEMRFASRQTTVDEALNFFHEGQSRKIVALIITENGRAEEKPLAFLTVWDLAEAARLLDGQAETG